MASWQVEENITEDVLDKKINELVASRGRKNTDPREVLRKLEVLSKSARPLGARKEIPVLMHLISAMFDSQRGETIMKVYDMYDYYLVDNNSVFPSMLSVDD